MAYDSPNLAANMNTNSYPTPYLSDFASNKPVITDAKGRTFVSPRIMDGTCFFGMKSNSNMMPYWYIDLGSTQFISEVIAFNNYDTFFAKQANPSGTYSNSDNYLYPYIVTVGDRINVE